VNATIDLGDIQGGILRGYKYDTATYALVRDPDRAGLGRLADLVRTAEAWTDKPQAAVNLALTATGLQALGVPLDGFPPEFRAGMAERRARLGDDGHNDPEAWERGLRGRGEGHVLVWVQGHTAEDVRRGADEALGALGGSEVWRQDAAILPDAREHFGFSDGFAQPSVAGSGQENRPGEGVPGRRGWRLLRPGEIVLGYEDEDGLLPPAPPAPLHRNATFMVLRKLRQHVGTWRAWLRDMAPAWAGGDERWLAAKIVGRWDDGTPVTLAPERPQARVIRDDLHRINAFRYGDDPLGLKCPVGAHVRRVNAREGLAGGAARTRRHRIIRRGMPYGPPYDGDDDTDRGLLFSCFNASIARQFEVVQGWCVDGNLFGLGPGERDLLAGGGDGNGGFTIPGAPPVRVPGPGSPLVTVRGGEYLYVPSIRGLRAIAAGDAG
jgi:Dyp-type peroxidase family